MKVLHLAAGNLFGGVETYLLTLARLRHLCPEMEPQFGVCFPGRLSEELRAAAVPVHQLGAVRASRPWSVWLARRRLKRLLQDQRFDVVITHGCWPHAMFAPTIRSRGSRLVNAVHDTLAGKHWVERWAARQPPDLVLANSRFTAGPAARLFPTASVEVCYLPVPNFVAADRAAAREAVRGKLGTAANAVVILQASRLERWKGHTVHLEALSRLGDVPGWEAWFAGGPQKAGETDYFAELTATAERNGIASRVRFLGQRTDVPQLMLAADIYCQPNTGPEPFGVVFIEALHAGLPVLGSASGGAIEIVADSCGILCAPGDAVALSEALCRLISDPGLRARLGAVGPGRAVELCDPARQLAHLASAVKS